MKLVESYSFADLISPLESANRLLAVRDSSLPISDTVGSGFEEYAKSNPIYAILIPNLWQKYNDGRYFPVESSEIGFIEEKDTAKLLAYFSDSDVMALFPPDMTLQFIPDLQGKLAVHTIKKKATTQEITADQIKLFEFQESGTSSLTRMNSSGDLSLFLIHLNVDLFFKLQEDKMYTLFMTIDSTTLAGSLETTNSASSVKMNSISNDLKKVLKKMYKDKVIEN